MCGSSGGGGAAGSLSFGWGQLPGSHGGRSKGGDLQTQQKTRKGEERSAKISCGWRGGGGGGGGGGEGMTVGRIFKDQKFTLAMPRHRALLNGEAWLLSGLGLYVAAYPWIRATQRCKALSCYVPESLKQKFFSGVEIYAATYQKVWPQFFFSF